MRAAFVGEDRAVLSTVVTVCGEIPGLDEVKGFTDIDEAFVWIKESNAGVSLLDLDMPDMNGLEFAKKLREEAPATAVIFLSGSDRYAMEALEFHAAGYIIKPVKRARLINEISYAIAHRHTGNMIKAHVRTFGEFDLLVDGSPVFFSRSKAKELLAYLVDRQGASVSRKAISGILFEDDLYDRSKQKYLDSIIRSLRETLKKYGVSDILEMDKGMLRICPEKLECDVYRFFEGLPESVNAYWGEYMSSYSWASTREASMDSNKARLLFTGELRMYCAVTPQRE